MMMSKQYFSDSEWVILLQAPTQAVLMVLLADKGDPVFFLKEVQAAVQILNGALQQEASSDLLKSVLDSLQQRLAQHPVQGEALQIQQQFELIGLIQGLKDVSEGQKQAIAHLDQVKSILAAKVPLTQAEEFNQWIVGIATQVARVVKEGGGLFNLGNESISRAEAGGISSIEKALKFK
jgi:hypothetical protein